MPYAEFQSGNAGLALPQYQFSTGLQSMEAGMSMMDRARRRKFAEEEMGMRREKHAADLVTTDIQQKSSLAELAMRNIQLKDAERSASELTSLRDQYAAAAPRITDSLNQISRMRDPAEQRRLFNQLQSQAAIFQRDPNLRAVLDKQFAATHDTIAANESSNLAVAVANNLTAPDEATARQKFPGQALQYTVDPSSGIPVWVATGKPDPTLESRAISLLSLADTEEELRQAAADPAVNMMLGAPGSKVGELYRSQRAKLRAEGQVDAGIGVKRSAAAAGKPIPSTIFESTEKIRNSYDSLQDIKKTYDSDPGLQGPFVGLIRDMNPWDTDAKTLLAKVTAAVPTLARGVFGEVGVLTDSDMATYRSLLPNTRSPEAAAKKLFEFLTGKLEAVYNKRLESLRAQGYSTSGFDPIGKGDGSAPVNGSRAQAIARGGAKTP